MPEYLQHAIFVVYLYQQITITMALQEITLQDLKNNREYIIAQITEKVGEEKVKSVMSGMLNQLDCLWHSLDDMIDSTIEVLNFTPSRKDSASTIAYNNFLVDNDLRYNQLKKDFEKI